LGLGSPMNRAMQGQVGQRVEGKLMNYQEIKEIIGKTGALSQTDGLIVHVTITDAKKAYGNLRYSVKPVAGAGEVWVSAERVAVLS